MTSRIRIFIVSAARTATLVVPALAQAGGRWGN